MPSLTSPTGGYPTGCSQVGELGITANQGWVARRPLPGPSRARETPTLHRIREVRCLDTDGLEWEWVAGNLDFHAREEAELDCWLLQAFRLGVGLEEDDALVCEMECPNLLDALLCSIDLLDRGG